ncbi:MAG: dehydrogenase [Methylibium sp.]|nr:dehydrogenase [Methylibium sp.]
MQPKRILILQGHPDSTAPHFCHALAEAYAAGAVAAGHELRQVDVAWLDFPLLRSKQDWEHGMLPASLLEAQQAIGWCEHVVIFFPLWLGEMPALLKGFLEQVARPGFAFNSEGGNPLAHKALSGRSARVVVTMGMPALVYRYFYRAHSLKSLERNILGFVGIAPIKETLIGMIEGMDEAQRQKWLDKLRALGGEGH